jgi:hypothetical protein
MVVLPATRNEQVRLRRENRRSSDDDTASQYVLHTRDWNRVEVKGAISRRLKAWERMVVRRLSKDPWIKIAWRGEGTDRFAVALHIRQRLHPTLSIS